MLNKKDYQYKGLFGVILKGFTKLNVDSADFVRDE